MILQTLLQCVIIILYSTKGANMLHHIYFINPEGADNYMIVPFDEIEGTVAFLESLDHEVVAYWPIEAEA